MRTLGDVCGAELDRGCSYITEAFWHHPSCALVTMDAGSDVLLSSGESSSYEEAVGCEKAQKYQIRSMDCLFLCAFSLQALQSL